MFFWFFAVQKAKQGKTDLRSPLRFSRVGLVGLARGLNFAALGLAAMVQALVALADESDRVFQAFAAHGLAAVGRGFRFLLSHECS
jgi:hypothetical protein